MAIKINEKKTSIAVPTEPTEEFQKVNNLNLEVSYFSRKWSQVVGWWNNLIRQSVSEFKSEMDKKKVDTG